MNEQLSQEQIALRLLARRPAHDRRDLVEMSHRTAILLVFLRHFG